MNKASGGDGIPVELFQILKDGAVKVMHSVTANWKTQQWPQDWKSSKITADHDCNHEIKTLAPWKKNYDKPRQYIKRQRHHFVDKDPHS